MAVFFVCAGLIGVLAVLLTLNVGRMRTRKKIFLGDGGDKELLSAVRAHANLIELTPLALLLIWLMHGLIYRWRPTRFEDAGVEYVIEHEALRWRRIFSWIAERVRGGAAKN